MPDISTPPPWTINADGSITYNPGKTATISNDEDWENQDPAHPGFMVGFVDVNFIPGIGYGSIPYIDASAKQEYHRRDSIVTEEARVQVIGADGGSSFPQLALPIPAYLIFGTIEPDGAVSAKDPSGWTVRRNGPGDYWVTFTQEVPNPAYSLTATATTTGGQHVTLNVNGATTYGFGIHTFLSDTGTMVDTYWSFQIIGVGYRPLYLTRDSMATFAQMRIDLFAEPRENTTNTPGAGAITIPVSQTSYAFPGSALSSSTAELLSGLNISVVAAYWDVVFTPSGDALNGIELVTMDPGPTNLVQIGEVTGHTETTPRHYTVNVTSGIQDAIAATASGVPTGGATKPIGHRMKCGGTTSPVLYASRIDILYKVTT